MSRGCQLDIFENRTGGALAQAHTYRYHGLYISFKNKSKMISILCLADLLSLRFQIFLQIVAVLYEDSVPQLTQGSISWPENRGYPLPLYFITLTFQPTRLPVQALTLFFSLIEGALCHRYTTHFCRLRIQLLLRRSFVRQLFPCILVAFSVVASVSMVWEMNNYQKNTIGTIYLY